MLKKMIKNKLFKIISAITAVFALVGAFCLVALNDNKVTGVKADTQITIASGNIDSVYNYVAADNSNSQINFNGSWIYYAIFDDDTGTFTYYYNIDIGFTGHNGTLGDFYYPAKNIMLMPVGFTDLVDNIYISLHDFRAGDNVLLSGTGFNMIFAVQDSTHLFGFNILNYVKLYSSVNNQIIDSGYNNFAVFNGYTADSFDVVNKRIGEIIDNTAYLQGYQLGFNDGEAAGVALGYESGRTEGFNSGYHSGYDTGYDEGNALGYSNGYTDGYQLGVQSQAEIIQNAYQDGYNDGVSDTESFDENATTIFAGIANIAMLPLDFFLEIFNWNLLGINLKGLMMSIISIAVVVIVVKITLGAFRKGR